LWYGVAGGCHHRNTVFEPFWSLFRKKKSKHPVWTGCKLWH
jgi:hypothetical protein